MLVLSLKSYILHEESCEDHDIKVMRLDSSDAVELEIKKNNNTIVRKKFDNLDIARKFIQKIKNKFRKKDNGKTFNLGKTKEARLNSDNPKAFSDGSPSENPFMSSGPGGFLDHVEKLKKKKNPFNLKNKKPKGDGVAKPSGGYTGEREKWDSTNGSDRDDGMQLSRLGPEGGWSRDNGPDRPGFQDALRERGEGSREKIPVGEDPIDVMKNPHEYKVNYDAISPGDRQTYQDIEEDRKQQKMKREQKDIKDKPERYYITYYDSSGNSKKIMDLTMQDAVQQSKQFPGAKITREKGKRR
jgi:hypothetical protein